MMLMPSIFRNDFMDDFFNLPERFYPSTRSLQTNTMMQTDVKETEDSYEVTVNLPGFAKEDIKGELKNGYLTIRAESAQKKDETDEKGRYIRRERHYGSCSRSFYVGDAITREDIKAKFENGTLKFTVPKKEKDPTVEASKYISIEG